MEISQKKREKLYFLPLFPPTLLSDSKRVEMQQPFFFSSAGFQREKKYIIEIWGGKGKGGWRVSRRKHPTPPPNFFLGAPRGQLEMLQPTTKLFGGEGGRERGDGTVVCGGDRGKRILSIGCSTCMYRIYLLYKENYENN